MKTAIEIMDNHINIALDQLDKLRSFLTGGKYFIETVDWKAWFIDIFLPFEHSRENYNSTGYNKLVNLKEEIEKIFSLLEIKNYTVLDKKEFDAKVSLKYKNGDVVEFPNKDFSQQIQTLYTGFYLRLVSLINDYRETDVFSVTCLDTNYYELNEYDNNKHDNEPKTLASGFCVYVLWNNINAENIYSLFGKYPRRNESHFESYYKPLFEKYKDNVHTYDEIKEADFINNEIINEENNLQKLIELPGFIIKASNYGQPITIEKVEKLTTDYIDWLKNKLQDKKEETPPPKPKKPEFIPKTDSIKDYIDSDHIEKFKEMEKELYELDLIDNSYQWKTTKILLCDLLCILIEYKFFRLINKGKDIKIIHQRQFISERYGFKVKGCSELSFEKTALTETWKKKNPKPKFENAIFSFQWMKKYKPTYKYRT